MRVEGLCGGRCRALRQTRSACFSRRISFKGTPSEDNLREASLGLLTGYLGPIVDAIVGSVGRCPPTMRLAFKQLHQCVEEHFPQAEHKVGQVLPLGRWGD